MKCSSYWKVGSLYVTCSSSSSILKFIVSPTILKGWSYTISYSSLSLNSSPLPPPFPPFPPPFLSEEIVSYVNGQVSSHISELRRLGLIEVQSSPSPSFEEPRKKVKGRKSISP